MTQRGYWREADGEQVTVGEAIAAWSTEAYPALEKVAGTYQALITYGDLAEVIQAASGIRTSSPFRHWIGRVLFLLVQEGLRRGDPPLTALVVHRQDGRVGEGYKAVLEAAGEKPIDDDLAREKHAAAARLACYERFGAAIPADGGKPALSPALQGWVNRKAKAAAAAPRPVVLCPKCSLQLPSTGICDNCAY
ncbi:MAG: hypothetical protein ABW046_08525 [Actinoplanes sp.]